MASGRWSGALTTASAVVVLLTGCGEPESAAPAEPVRIVSVIDDVAYYIGCANEPVDVEGTTWYPVADWGNDEMAALYDDITTAEREQPVTIRGFAPSVAPPGPGDDVGTLVVYADGYAWYASDSGQTIWLTDDEQTYNWVC